MLRAFLVYVKNIIQHKLLVMSLCLELSHLDHRIVWRGLVHDLSSFYPDEVLVFLRSVHPKTKKDDIDWTEAVYCLHFQRNSHHWEYHTVVLPVKEGGSKILGDHKVIAKVIPALDLLEMIINETAYSIHRNYNQIIREWSLDADMVIHPRSREHLDKILGMINSSNQDNEE